VTACASPLTIVEALRGHRETRPARDTAGAEDRRERLEVAVADLLAGDGLDRPLVVRSSAPARPGVATIAERAPGRLRGLLLGQLLRLLCVGAVVDDPLEWALAAWRAERPAGDLVDYVDDLAPDDRARLATDVAAHFVTLRRQLGDVGRWPARTNARACVHLGGGRVIVRDTIDLVLGSVHDDPASTALLDLTTAALGEASERALRFHALVETLRAGVVPLRVAAFSSATGELWVRDVDAELLDVATLELVDALRAARDAVAVVAVAA